MHTARAANTPFCLKLADVRATALIFHFGCIFSMKVDGTLFSIGRIALNVVPHNMTIRLLSIIIILTASCKMKNESWQTLDFKHSS
jgi:hypothetical protein